MCEEDRISEIENALYLLGLEKCHYCSSWDRKENFKTVRLWSGKITNCYCCSTCQKTKQ